MSINNNAPPPTLLVYLQQLRTILPPLMATSGDKKEILFAQLPFLCVYKDGSFDRPLTIPDVPASVDPLTGVISKDIDIAAGISARLYLPSAVTTAASNGNLPLLIYIHGGGFTVGTARSPWYHAFLNTLVSKSNVIAYSVDYRNAPEHRLPAAYDDCKTALSWLSASAGASDDWIANYADFNRVYLAGDSAGANIAHHMATQSADLKLNFDGIVSIHPYFWGSEKFESEIGEVEGRFLNPSTLDVQWGYIFPSTTGLDDPLMNPTAAEMKKIECGRVLVFVAEKDLLRERGKKYAATLESSRWRGVLEVVESAGEDHGFHFPKPQCDNAVAMIDKIVDFISR